MKINKLFVFAAVLALLSAMTLTPTVSAEKPASVTVQILAVNDFHGALDPSLTKPSSTDNTTWYYRGGAEYLTKFVQDAAATNPNTIKVSAGDMIGASPLLSALFHDEPTVMAFNQMGFDFSNTGNHEFDEGWHELLRMQNGGCHPIDGCFPGVPVFPGASFEYLAGNIIRLDNGMTLFPSYGVRQFDGVKVGLIGIALEVTPTIVVPSGVEGLVFEAEVDAINKYVKMLKDTEGLKAIVVILHDGAGAGPTINSCNLSDPFFANVVMNIDPEVDALITGHTHNAYNCQVQVKKNYDPMLVTGAGYNGRYLTDIDLTIAGTNGQVIGKTATNIPVETPYLGAVPDPAMKALLDQYRTASAPLANRVVGTITADIKRGGNMVESALGDVIADAQLAVTSDPAYGGAVVAMTNPGGIRTDLLYAQISGGELPGEVTFAEAFAVQPFSNSLVTLTLTGAQLKAVLEQQATAGSDGSGRMLQISYTLTYTWSTSAPVGSKVSNLKINGVDVDPAASYRITVNNFLAGGGDGFTSLLAGTDLLTGMIDLDAFVEYLTANSPVAPGPQNRITMVP
ncbi:MAG: bifunctional metallophosphatase/5'-nucleotidase [Anaerolineales bacterium]|nr:bifunctional metallophosphatase/5'-nucleotidase [Anaerolineae bacterium]PWB69505.1 MAG: bifunctional metallophosphatase/5'-nucleotidase [Anaerolineales bacterium]